MTERQQAKLNDLVERTELFWDQHAGVSEEIATHFYFIMDGVRELRDELCPQASDGPPEREGR